MNNIIFLDIDGTLVDFQMRMPDSAKKALSMARDNGHKLALCTGRAYSNIYPWLLDFGFDGVVASAGAYIVSGKEVIYHNTLDAEELEKKLPIIESHGACYMLQGINGRYISQTNQQQLVDRYSKAGVDVTAFFEEMHIVEEPWKMSGIESGMYFEADVTVGQMQREIGDIIKVTGCSYGPDREFSGELTSMGVDKSTGMRRLMEHMGTAWENSVAFGDGPNDVEMLDYANLGIAMGNATEELKGHADMITSPIDQDGIYYAFKKLRLI